MTRVTTAPQTGKKYLITATNITPGVWIHVVITWDTPAQAFYYYKDGQLTGQKLSSGSDWTPDVRTSNVIIGEKDEAHFDIDDFCVWWEALNSNQISQLYQTY